jgi:probable phosphoglycerate mutase
VLDRADAAGGDVLLFGHGHQMRIVAAVALDLDPTAGARLLFEPAHVSIIGHEREVRALRRWNDRA